MVNKRGPYKGRKEYAATTAAGLGADWQRFRAQVLARDEYVCQYCGNAANTVDHVIPRSKGGESTPDNCVAACGPCNSGKRDRLAPRRVPSPAVDSTPGCKNPPPSKPRAPGWYTTNGSHGPCSRQWDDDFVWHNPEEQQ